MVVKCSPDLPLLCHVARIFLEVSRAHIADRGKLTFAACAVHAVIDGNEMNAKLRENNIGIHSHLEIIAPEAAHVLYDDALDPSCLDVGKHTLEARTVEVCAGIAVVLVIMAVIP